MKRTQIQLPEALYDQVKRAADAREWSVSELLRRGAEYMVSVYPAAVASNDAWTLPLALDLGPFLLPVEQWRDALADEEARIEQYSKKPEP